MRALVVEDDPVTRRSVTGLREQLGFEVLKAIRSNPAHEDMRVMMVTAKNETEDLRLALEAAADECLLKPVEFSTLSSKLDLLQLIPSDDV